jgi:hypothetical protein
VTIHVGNLSESKQVRGFWCLILREMKHSMAVVIICFALSPPSATPERAITNVVIKSSWAGWGVVPETDIVIQRAGEGYRRAHDQVEAKLVEALASALQESPMSQPEPLNLGITETWLNGAVPNLIQRDVSWDAATASQKQLFISSFSDLATIKAVLPSLYNFVRMDDYPSVQVELDFDDGTTISASSQTPYQFMLPWKVVRGSETTTTYNADISRAIVALMPKKSTNRTRLTGDGLDRDLDDAVRQKIKNQWNLLGVEDKAGSALALLEGLYVVETADINQYHNVDYGKAWKEGTPKETNLQVTLRKPSFPANFSERAILLYADGKVQGTDLFLKKIVEYEGRVESVPWLTRYRKENPKVPFQLIFVHDCSFGDKAMSIFESDMKAIGKADLANEIHAVQDKVALVAAGFGGYWLILPDGRMCLWRYSTTAGLLEWASTGLTTRRCSDYNTVSGGCVGALVTPDGVITN